MHTVQRDSDSGLGLCYQVLEHDIDRWPIEAPDSRVARVQYNPVMVAIGNLSDRGRRFVRGCRGDVLSKACRAPHGAIQLGLANFVLDKRLRDELHLAVVRLHMKLAGIFEDLLTVREQKAVRRAPDRTRGG